LATSTPGQQTTTGWEGKLAKGEKELLTSLFRRGHLIFGHNLAFDLKFTHRTAGDLAFEPQFQDSIINEPLINEFAGKFSLEACAERHGVQAKKGAAMVAYLRGKFPEIKSDREAMGHYWRLAGDDPMGVEYATGDGTTTWQLIRAQDKVIEAEELTRVHLVESRLIRVLARMTCKGIKVDVGYFEQLLEKLNGQISEMLQVFPDPENASPQAPSDVKWWMEKHKVTDWPMTPKTNKPSFPESWLEKSEPGRKIIEMRRLVHMRNSFIRPLLEEHIWNGRVHANFNQLRNDEYGTITGRLSCDSPNLQQAHKRDAVRGRMLRGGFIPDDGMVFGEVDYSQCEPRLLAYYSQCKVLRNGYLATPSVDAHTAVAVAMYPGFSIEALNDKTHDLYKDHKDKRENAKRVNQTLVTGGGKGVIVERYKVDPREVDKIWNNYFGAMPEIRTLQKNAAKRMEQRGYVKSLLGRRARLRDRNKSYIAVNRLLQCGNADILKEKMVEIDDYLASQGRPPVHLLNNIHDAFDFQFDPDHRKVYEECLSIMTRFGPDDVITLDIPMEIDAGEGKTWADATFGEQ
jgi:DNA polymerase-1